MWYQVEVVLRVFFLGEHIYRYVVTAVYTDNLHSSGWCDQMLKVCDTAWMTSKQRLKYLELLRRTALRDLVDSRPRNKQDDRDRPFLSTCYQSRETLRNATCCQSKCPLTTSDNCPWYLQQSLPHTVSRQRTQISVSNSASLRRPLFPR